MSKLEEFRRLFVETVLNNFVETASTKASQYKVTSPEEFEMLVSQDPTYDSGKDDGEEEADKDGEEGPPRQRIADPFRNKHCRWSGRTGHRAERETIGGRVSVLRDDGFDQTLKTIFKPFFHN